MIIFLIHYFFKQIIAGRLVNFLMPRQYSLVIKALSSEDKPLTENIPYMEIGIFVLLRSLQGSIGLLNNVQTFVWIPVSQYTTRELSVSMLQHLHNLSIRFHLNRKTGEILRVQDRGVASVVSVLNAVLFNIIPTLIDIGVAIIVFVTKFDIYIGGVVFLTTIKLTDWRTKYRRRCNKLDNEMEARAVDSLLNFETIKYFGNEEFEVNQYAKSIDKYQNADLETKVVSSILNTLQNIIIQIGLLVGCLIGAYRIINKQINLNEFIWIIAYIDQLYGPLNWFGGYYRTIQKNFIDMENMLDLFKVPIEINDNLNVKEFNIIKGEIEFKNVSFHYDSRLSILKNISFKVPSGSTVALVGPSGGGKSTILRLLFRFYDINSGQILIDNKDIRDMKQKDLRKSIGVVPQDSVLFNEDLYYNILYGKINSTKQEIEIAAKAAQIHERILSFPDQYHTKVGERGLRLSGGEKQRIAIARTFLRDPKIVLLDEATSALDTTTERQIQSSLKSITKGRTTLIIAHRLSTIIEADIILVLNQGEIIERGSHNELMNNPNGINNNINNNNNNKFSNKSQVKNIKRECEFNEDSDNYDPSIDSNPLLPFSTSCPAYF
ncbi:P-loop containing nucleoside triphosphate hydrolase protein [Neoconidiobolus thromboides FSU 785]|nr:P-loop containing nucleoside triphosphate hydrolase protein [Neoconidiobolus thromboides FSU 785]